MISPAVSAIRIAQCLCQNRLSRRLTFLRIDPEADLPRLVFFMIEMDSLPSG